MNTKKLFIVAAAAALAPFAFSVAAECEDDEGGQVKTGYAQVAENSSQEGKHKNHKDNDNSNRQSDPDSTRGQARAEERRREKQKNSDSKDKDFDSKEDRAWYDPRGLVDRVRENPWYDPLGLFN